MKRTCKQCGKEFILTKSEIDFYKSKNLSLPKRCKECRESNKKANPKKPANDTVQVASYYAGTAVGNKNPGKIAVIIGVMAALIALFIGIKIYQNANKPDEIVYQPQVVVGDIETDIEEPVVEKPDIVVDTGDIETGTEDLVVTVEEPDLITGDIAVTVDTPDEIAGDIVVNADNPDQSSENTEEASTAQEQTAVDQTAQDPAPQQSAYRFRSAKLLNQHYEKHGKEMGFDSAASYEAAAAAVITNPAALSKTEKEDGDMVYYVESTNEFVVLSTDGYIRTYFYPSAGKKYYDRQ